MNVQLHFETGHTPGAGGVEVVPFGDPAPANFDAATDDITLWNDYGPIVLKRVDTTTGLPGVYGFRDIISLQAEIGARVEAKAGFDPANSATYTQANWDLLSAAEKAVAARWMVVPRTGVSAAALRDEVYPGTAGADAQAALLGGLNRDLFLARRQRLLAANARAFVHLADPADFLAYQIALTELPIGTHVHPDGVNNDLVEPVGVAVPAFSYTLLGVEGTVESGGREGLVDYLLAREDTKYATTGLAAQSWTVLDLSPADCPTLAALMVDILRDGLY